MNTTRTNHEAVKFRVLFHLCTRSKFKIPVPFDDSKYFTPELIGQVSLKKSKIFRTLLVFNRFNTTGLDLNGNKDKFGYRF